MPKLQSCLPSGILFVSILFLTLGAPFDEKLVGAFAVANVFQIISFCLLIPFIHRYIKLSDLFFVLLLIVGFILAALSIEFTYGIDFKVMHSLFFTVAITQVIYLWRIADHHPRDNLNIMEAFAISIYPMLVYLLGYGLYDVLINNNLMVYFGFDDKSHAVFVCDFYAYLALFYLEKTKRFIISALFAILSFLTLSRIAFIFLPFYLALLGWHLAKEYVAFFRSLQRLRLNRNIIVILLASLSISGVTYYVADKLETFRIFDRLANDNKMAQDSTKAHEYLLQYGMQLKFSNLQNFFFGITPGGFSNVLENSGIDISDFRELDPAAYTDMEEGNAPMHSTHVSVLTEFPFPFFISYVCFLVYLGWRLLTRRCWQQLMFYIPFIISISFYSSHNELFFYGILTYLIAVSSQKQMARILAPRVTYYPKAIATTGLKCFLGFITLCAVMISPKYIPVSKKIKEQQLPPNSTP